MTTGLRPGIQNYSQLNQAQKLDLKKSNSRRIDAQKVKSHSSKKPSQTQANKSVFPTNY